MHYECTHNNETYAILIDKSNIAVKWSTIINSIILDSQEIKSSMSIIICVRVHLCLCVAANSSLVCTHIREDMGNTTTWLGWTRLKCNGIPVVVFFVSLSLSLYRHGGFPTFGLGIDFGWVSFAIIRALEVSETTTDGYPSVDVPTCRSGSGGFREGASWMGVGTGGECDEEVSTRGEWGG